MNTSWLPHAAFWSGVVLMVALGNALHGAARQALDSIGWVDHTHDVIGAVRRVQEELGRADAAQRGYLLSGNPSFLLERDRALGGLDEAIARLKSFTADNPSQRAHIPALAALVAERRSHIAAQMRDFERGERVPNPATVSAAQRTSEALYSVAGAMERHEEELLELRRAAVREDYEKTVRLLLISMAAGAMILVPAYVGFILQAQARKRAEHTLKDMAESIPGAVYRVRAEPGGEWHYEFLSRNVARLHGIDWRRAIEDPPAVLETIVAEDRAGMLAAAEKAAQSLSYLEYDYRVAQPDGTIKWIRTSAAPRREPDGTMVWNGFWADITAQKRLEQALHDAKEEAETASRAKGTFLAIMSHEIRTPLNGVLGMLELLSLTPLDHDQRTTLNVIRESGRSLQRIIDDILDFSKIEAGKLEIAPVPSSIADVVRGTRNIYAGNASSKGLTLEAYVDPRIRPALIVDPVRLQQILNNLVSNAIKFTHAGRVEIRAESLGVGADSETVRFSVRDTGIGISPQARERLFQPFAQINVDNTRGVGGTGLGLTICRRLAEMMGGTIEMDSAPGKGTTVCLTLTLRFADLSELVRHPLPPSAGPAAAPSIGRTAPSIDDAAREGTLLLLVDDHPVNRMLVCRQAQMLGYAVEAAENGADALARWRTGRFAAVITDVNMPEMDGYELCRRIRAIEAAEGRERTPVIACTANALRGEAEKCFGAGMDDYLPKPVELHELGSKLKNWVPLQTDPTEAGVIDESVLGAISGGSADDEREILEEFRRANEDDLAALRKSIASGDMDKVARCAHRMKGASRMVGAMRLAAACERVERCARANDVEGVKRAMAEIEREVEALEGYVATRA